ncbi:DUF362 domain-containing protein [Paramaledivibacter caminithermalis]|jgi:uncharacterized protein (DUF362 family)/Pyruvate/2-oxoacid:ferredoxin oxidoreductase delta subunit|uniref:Ferredoxin n=1 Tax=Paramaledivibacter caminithermalis (strain DSM 15212 / CIP 107654 / DViRD3) TaxID=1121301 RepID=A0A1M6MKE0_PARC5|nr:DUF362 domain-containing protein [Paramaledivibacter caminithermalis]SHJ83965.1 Uncharacterized conserved protein, DUF362 family [Paramaledivibacter caminithermalis DSM 15212]
MEKVSLVRCEDYDYSLVKKAVDECFENLGGVEKYINPGDRVLLKLNLLMKKRPEEATTTHPVFTKALAKTLIEHGAEVVIGDSPGGPFNAGILKGVYKACGIEEIANEVGAKLNYNTNSVDIKNEDGLILKKITAIEVLKEVDKVISVSKLKTHGMMMFTGAVKNMFGIVAGLEKAEYHVRMKKNVDFSNALVDICLAANPILSFMDGIVGMEGAGPSGGKPRRIGAVIASTSPYHLDVVATSIIGIKPTKVPTIERCIERGLCSGSLEDIEIKGDDIESFIIKDFIVPEIRSLDLLEGKLPKFLRDIINGLMQPKPLFKHDKCVGCSDCAQSCPPKVIEMINNKPHVKLEGCIRCFCCQELCPVKAIDIHRPLFMKLLARL